MIIVPAFAKADQSNPKVVRRKVARDKPPRSPRVSAGVDQPGAMQDNHCAKEHSPENERQSAKRKQYKRNSDHWQVVVLRNPHMKFRLGQDRKSTRLNS